MSGTQDIKIHLCTTKQILNMKIIANVIGDTVQKTDEAATERLAGSSTTELRLVS